MFQQLDLTNVSGLQSFAFCASGSFQSLTNIPKSLQAFRATFPYFNQRHSIQPELHTLPKLMSMEFDDTVPFGVIEGFAARINNEPCALRNLSLSFSILSLRQRGPLREALRHFRNVEKLDLRGEEVDDSVGDQLAGMSPSKSLHNHIRRRRGKLTMILQKCTCPSCNESASERPASLV